MNYVKGFVVLASLLLSDFLLGDIETMCKCMYVYVSPYAAKRSLELTYAKAAYCPC